MPDVGGDVLECGCRSLRRQLQVAPLADDGDIGTLHDGDLTGTSLEQVDLGVEREGVGLHGKAHGRSGGGVEVPIAIGRSEITRACHKHRLNTVLR